MPPPDAADASAVQLAQQACVRAWQQQEDPLSLALARQVAKWCHTAPPMGSLLLQACR